MNEEKEYELHVSWTEQGVISVIASSYDEAVNMAYDDSSLPNGEYLSGSFNVDGVLGDSGIVEVPNE